MSCSSLLTCGRFVYLGPKGSWTGLHADVFRSYSWFVYVGAAIVQLSTMVVETYFFLFRSFNVCGRKKWILFPPAEACKLFDAHGIDIMYLHLIKAIRKFT